MTKNSSDEVILGQIIQAMRNDPIYKEEFIKLQDLGKAYSRNNTSANQLKFDSTKSSIENEINDRFQERTKRTTNDFANAFPEGDLSNYENGQYKGASGQARSSQLSKGAQGITFPSDHSPKPDVVVQENVTGSRIERVKNFFRKIGEKIDNFLKAGHTESKLGEGFGFELPTGVRATLQSEAPPPKQQPISKDLAMQAKNLVQGQGVSAEGGSKSASQQPPPSRDSSQRR